MRTAIIIKWALIEKRNSEVMYAELVEYESGDTIIMADLAYIVKTAYERNYVICNLQEAIYEVVNRGYKLTRRNDR